MAFTIPDNDESFNTNQSLWMQTDIDNFVLGIQGNGVLSGCAVTAQGSPDMTVAVAAGTIQWNGVSVTVASGNVTITAANGTNPRIDLVVVDNAGVKSATAGTAAASPKAPALPANSIMLAMVYVPANDTTIATNQIVDKRTITTTGVGGSSGGYDSVTTTTASQKVSFWDWFTILGELAASSSTGYGIVGGTNSQYQPNTTTGKRVMRVFGSTGVAGNRGGVRNAETNPFTIRASENYSFKTIIHETVAPIGGTVEANFGFRLNETSSAQDGIFFRSINSANWFLVCRNSGVESTVDMGIGLDSTVRLLEFRITGDGTNVQGYVDGTLTGAAITTNIPSAGLFVMGMIDNTISTISTAQQIDMLGWGWQGDMVA